MWELEFIQSSKEICSYCTNSLFPRQQFWPLPILKSGILTFPTNLSVPNIFRTKSICLKLEFVVVWLLSHVWLFVTPWTVTCQASQSFTISTSLLNLMFIGSVMPSDHFILYCPCLSQPSVFPSTRDFSNELALCVWWPFRREVNGFSLPAPLIRLLCTSRY